MFGSTVQYSTVGSRIVLHGSGYDTLYGTSTMPSITFKIVDLLLQQNFIDGV